MLKRLFGWAGGLALNALVAVRLALPEPAARALARGAGRLALRLAPGRRAVARRNLRRALGPAADPARLDAVLRASGDLLAVSFSDQLRLFRLDRDRFCAVVRAEGEEHLRTALAGGRGAILVSGHYGAFPMLAPALPARGFPFHLLYRLPKAGPVRRLFARWLDRTGATIIEDQPRHLAAVRCLEALAGGACVCLLVDQHFAAGVEVPFFGAPAKTGVGAALLAARSGAPLVPVRLTRNPDGTYRLRFEPAVAPPATRERDDLTACTARLTAVIEAWIREDPAPWFWLHRRWKDLDRAEDARAA